MLQAIHRVASAIRNTPFMKRQTWLWRTVEPLWNRSVGALTRDTGFDTHIGDLHMRLDYTVGARLDKEGAYEPTFFTPFVEAVKKGQTIFDVGAYVGIFAVGAALMAGPDASVLAFEPAEESVRVLKRHLHMNGLDRRVEVLEGVVSDHTGEVSFFEHGTSMANSMSPKNVDDLNPEVFDRPAEAHTVHSFCLDDVCRERGIRPDVMKIDVEGAEFAVLQGAREILEQGDCAVFLEVHPEQMKNLGASEEELVAYLAELGYRIEPLDDRNPIGIYHSRLVRA